MVDVCHDAAKLNSVKLHRYTVCFMADFKAHLEGDDITFPVSDRTRLRQLLVEFTHEPRGEEGAVGAGYETFVKPKWIYFDPNTPGKLKYVTTTLPTFYMPRKFYTPAEVDPDYKEWETFSEDQNSKAPSGVNKMMFLTNGGLFIQVQQSRVFITSALNGVAISLGLAFVVLILSTLNIVIAVISVLAIMCIVGCMFGVMVMCGCSLGAIEAICATIVVGFSVDFVVHYANSYVESHDSTRDRRVRHSLFEMGVSVISGGVTTLAASFWLFFCYLEFFSKFGIFIFTTISLSLLFANTFFMATCAICGPEGEFGNLKAFCLAKKDNKNKPKPTRTV